MFCSGLSEEFSVKKKKKTAEHEEGLSFNKRHNLEKNLERYHVRLDVLLTHLQLYCSVFNLTSSFPSKLTESLAI